MKTNYIMNYSSQKNIENNTGNNPGNQLLCNNRKFKLNDIENY